MRQKLYNLKHGSLSVIQFKLEFDKHIVPFPIVVKLTNLNSLSTI